MNIPRIDKIIDYQIDNKIDNQIEAIFNSLPPVFPENAWLSVFNDNGTLFNYYNGLTSVSVENMGDYDCDPVGLYSGTFVDNLSFIDCAPNGAFALYSSPTGLFNLKTLSFNNCGGIDGEFVIYNNSGFTSLENLSFNNCGRYGCYYGDNSNLSYLNNLTFNDCGFEGFTFSQVDELNSLFQLTFNSCAAIGYFNASNIVGLNALQSLTFNQCGGNGFTIDTNGLIALESLTFYQCGGNSFFQLYSSNNLYSLTSLSIIECSINNFDVSNILINLDLIGNTEGYFEVSPGITWTFGSEGDAPMVAITNLLLKGWQLPGIDPLCSILVENIPAGGEGGGFTTIDYGTVSLLELNQILDLYISTSYNGLVITIGPYYYENAGPINKLQQLACTQEASVYGIELGEC